MARPLLPPRGIFIAMGILYAQDISPTERDTLIQLIGLAWGSTACRTPQLSYPILEQLTGKKERTLRRHLDSLRTYRDVLRLHPTGDGLFFLSFARWVFGRPVKNSESVYERTGQKWASSGQINRPVGHLKDYEEEEDSPSQSESVGIPPPEIGRIKTSAAAQKMAVHEGGLGENQAVSRAGAAGAARKGRTGAAQADQPGPGGAAQEKSGGDLPPKLRASLEEAGVFTSLFPEIARTAGEKGWTDKDLHALLAWCAEDSPDRPGGLFMGRLRHGFRPPRRYYRPACPYCGNRGKHADGCRGKYAEPYPGG